MRLGVQDTFSNDNAADILFVKQVCWRRPKCISTHYGNCGHSLMLSIISYAKVIWNRRVQLVFFPEFLWCKAFLMKRHGKGENRTCLWPHAEPEVELDQRLELADPQAHFQPKPFCDSMTCDLLEYVHILP